MPKNQVLDHVKIVESIMLRSRQHRAILIPTQIFIGLLSTVLGLAITFKTGPNTGLADYRINTGTWIFVWLLAATLSSVFACILRTRQAKHERLTKELTTRLGQGHLAHIFRSLAPALLMGVIVGTSLAFADVRQLPICAALLIASYGVALLSIRIYCTKSTRFLGLLMLALGITFSIVTQRTLGLVHPIQLANFFMILAFGMFHIIVALGSILFDKAGR